MEEQNKKKDSANRRGFVRKIIGLVAAGGIATALLGGQVDKANAAGAANQVAFYTAPNTLTGSDNLRWDDTYGNFVAGYSGNTTSGVAGGTISGGGTQYYVNTVSANYGTIGGGEGNTASGMSSTVAGGEHNVADREGSAVGGGYNNQASNTFSAVVGGASNQATGMYSTVGGGYYNQAGGNYSFAAGSKAKVLNTPVSHDGAFLFADNHNVDFNSAAANEFAVRCTGGARFVTAIDSSGNPTVSTVIDPSGRLGVGISSPGYLLDIRDSSGTNGLRVRTTDWYAVPYPGTIAESCVFNARGYNFATDGQTLSPGVSFGIGMAMNRPGACLQIKNPGGYSAIFEAGNVGIGTTSPTERLQVVGNVKATGFKTGDITFANNFNVTEDETTGLAFKNDAGEKIAVLDRQGNFYVKGKVIEGLPR